MLKLFTAVFTLLFFFVLSLYRTARQAVKNTPKRLPSVSVRSPLGASPPPMESQTDSLVPTPPLDTVGVTAEDTNTHPVVRTLQSKRCRGTLVKSCSAPAATRRPPAASTSQLSDPNLSVCQVQGVGVFLPVTDAPGPGPKDGGLAALVDDSPQKRLLAQKATPPPSPLLSELLKKGNLISASPRLVRAGIRNACRKRANPSLHILVERSKLFCSTRWARETPLEV